MSEIYDKLVYVEELSAYPTSNARILEVIIHLEGDLEAMVNELSPEHLNAIRSSVEIEILHPLALLYEEARSRGIIQKRVLPQRIPPYFTQQPELPFDIPIVTLPRDEVA